MADVFISYSKKDRALAERIDAALQDAGYSTWWDDNLIPAEQWSQKIVEEISSATVVLAIWTFSSIASSFVQDEAEIGRKANKLVPVRFDDVEPPLGQRTIQCADLSSWDGKQSALEWQRVLKAVRRVLQGGGVQAGTRSGEEFERRLTDIRPFDHAILPDHGSEDRWVQEKEFRSKAPAEFVDTYDLLTSAYGHNLEAVGFAAGFGRSITSNRPDYGHIEIVGGERRYSKTFDHPVTNFRLLCDAHALCEHRDGLKLIRCSPWYWLSHLSELITKAPSDFLKSRILSEWPQPDGKIYRNFTYDSPLLIVNGNIAVYQSWRDHSFRGDPSEHKQQYFDDYQPDWLGGNSERGRAARWDASMTRCLISWNDEQGYLLRKQGGSWSGRATPVFDGSALMLHPSGLLLRLRSLARKIHGGLADVA